MSQHSIYIHLPLSMYRKYREAVLAIPVGLELLVDHEVLVPEFRGEMKDIAAEIRERKIPCRFHAPFRNLYPAGHDPEAVDLARRRLQGALDLAPSFGVKQLVVHPAWDPRGDILDREAWLDRATAFWTSMLPSLEAAGASFVLENIFDLDPSLLVDLLARLPEDRFGFLFDTGHFHAFSEAGLNDWLSALGPRLQSIHIHDNGGQYDEHLALGQGSFPWGDLFELVGAQNRPLEWTLENRSVEDVIASLRFLGQSSGIAEFRHLAEIARPQAQKRP
ncbi:sugar phosphate isomerase/epimerase [bacterium]|nr:sugar phosphate isomerase/epimerase [bacterium]